MKSNGVYHNRKDIKYAENFTEREEDRRQLHWLRLPRIKRALDQLQNDNQSFYAADVAFKDVPRYGELVYRQKVGTHQLLMKSDWEEGADFMSFLAKSSKEDNSCCWHCRE